MAQHFFEARVGIGSALLDMTHRLLTPHKASRGAALVRTAINHFYAFYSQMVGRDYGEFRLSEDVPLRSHRAQSTL
jgi:hypothetical protein